MNFEPQDDESEPEEVLMDEEIEEVEWKPRNQSKIWRYPQYDDK